MKVKLDKSKAHQIYKNAAGKRLPGVTTILNVVNKPALINWAHRLGTDGISLESARQKALDAGSIAHFMVECHLAGNEPDLSDYAQDDIDKAENAYIKFLSWWESNGLTLRASELQLVSEAHQYGGTIDIVAAKASGEVWLVDLKSSKAIYEDNWRQLAAYRALWDEYRPDQAIDQACIVRIGKEADEDDFEAQVRPSTAKNFKAFLAAQVLYEALKAERRKG